MKAAVNRRTPKRQLLNHSSLFSGKQTLQRGDHRWRGEGDGGGCRKTHSFAGFLRQPPRPLSVVPPSAWRFSPRSDKNLEKIAVLVGPERRRKLSSPQSDGSDGFARRKRSFFVTRTQRLPLCRWLALYFSSSIRETPHPTVLGQSSHDRRQSQVPVGDMHRDYAVGGEMSPVDIKRLTGQQVRRNGVAAEGIDHDHVEFLAAAPLRATAWRRPT